LIEAVENLSLATETPAVTFKEHKVKRAEKGVRGVQGVAGVQGGGFAHQKWAQKKMKKNLMQRRKDKTQNRLFTEDHKGHKVQTRKSANRG
jgi:hypothetical protein